jgi:antitoxin component YwqK of YwqJK toxin-antitoxin module
VSLPKTCSLPAPIGYSLLTVLILLIGCSKEEHLSTDLLEYRTDDHGISRLYVAGDSNPVGKWKFARISDKYPNGQKKFEIGIVDGLRHGSFFFWQSNGLKKLEGSYERGKREGKFSAYGKAGELIYEKNFFEDELEGNFTLYYPMSNSEAFRYFEKTNKEGLKLGDIPLKSNIRMEGSFSKGIPVGPYRTYFHPRGQSGLSKEDLLEEAGRFDENGRLIGNQVCYYPRTEGLVVYVLDNEPSSIIHPPTPLGLSEAIDECYSAMEEIPAYRNPKNIPAIVYCVDRRSSRIAPVWSSAIHELAIRNFDGNILNERFKPNYENFSKNALTKAKELSLSKELSEATTSKTLRANKQGVEIIGLDQTGVVHDILWSEIPNNGILNLEERIFKKRKRIHRSWESGEALTSEWSISSGLNLIIRSQEDGDKLDSPTLILPSVK